jgi:hypothetical protein
MERAKPEDYLKVATPWHPQTKTGHLFGICCWRCRFPNDLTKGEAAELIDDAMARHPEKEGEIGP